MSKESILIIDDEETIRDGCRQVLQKSGYNVLTAADGTEGIKIAREAKPFLAFIDLKMPGISGTEIMDILSKDIPDIVLIVITGYASIVSAVESMKKGAYDYLPKPFTPDQLRAVAQRGLEHRGLKIEARGLKEEKERMEKNFITFVSHEMRSPLVAIQQYIEAIRNVMGSEVSKDMSEILERCSKRIQNVQDLVEHWLDVSRIEDGTFLKDKKPIDLGSIINKSVEELRFLCERRGLSIENNISNNLPNIVGDKESILRVLINIIGNATKYTPSGGKISVGTEYDDYYVNVNISDTGAGIPQEHLPFIFEPFYRVKGKQERHKGSGLGLTFSKRIMDAHGGTIEVSSREGKGTTFTLKFPR
ncbi:MAG: hybrid sensor histidine kinase/response regulator [Deltaproteobacteria bacterium]|nr:hybrid sensor histidine kinase/response regulator [Deltaproteobacteria bacterium]